MKKSSKKEAKEDISNFFIDIKNKDSKQIKKIKKLAMSHNISLKDKRKTFCKKCLTPYKKPKIRIRNKIKRVTCENCGYVSRWGIR
jgi:RNase P subunit RPR2